jgi:hypothetical protein
LSRVQWSLQQWQLVQKGLLQWQKAYDKRLLWIQ